MYGPSLRPVIDYPNSRVHPRIRAVCVIAGVLAALGVSNAAGAVSGVHAPSQSQRAASLRALVKQDGTAAGVTAGYLANSDHRLAAACQRTPDAGKVAFLFRASGTHWRYVLESGTANASSRSRRALERACLR